jgi:hypothetical protein
LPANELARRGGRSTRPKGRHGDDLSARRKGVAVHFGCPTVLDAYSTYPCGPEAFPVSTGTSSRSSARRRAPPKMNPRDSIATIASTMFLRESAPQWRQVM